jgi:NhaP-type Na+/H+ or K+/H+ antiporter
MIEIDNNESSVEIELIPSIPLAVFFMICTLAVGAVMKEITKKLPIPYPAAMFILGIFIGSKYNVIDTYLVKDALTLAREMDATQIMSILIPPIVFYSCKFFFKT